MRRGDESSRRPGLAGARAMAVHQEHPFFVSIMFLLFIPNEPEMLHEPEMQQETIRPDPAPEVETPQQETQSFGEDPRGEPVKTEMDFNLVVKHDDRDLRAALDVHAQERRRVIEERYGNIVSRL